MIEKYLPIGTVVMLKNGKKRLMIIGYGFRKDDNSTKVFDYIGALYPEGVLALDSAFGFDHEQIDTIFAMGFIDEEEKSFVKKLDDIIKNGNNNENFTNNNSKQE